MYSTDFKRKLCNVDSLNRILFQCPPQLLAPPFIIKKYEIKKGWLACVAMFYIVINDFLINWGAYMGWQMTDSLSHPSTWERDKNTNKTREMYADSYYSNNGYKKNAWKWHF